jgi:hypothetical protein
MKSGPLTFSDEEWARSHGHAERTDDGHLVWNAAQMGWRRFGSDGSYLGMLYPDHDRAQADPDYAPVYAFIHRILSPPRKHLKLVKPE